MLTAFVPVLSESSALGADRYFDYRIENYAEALSDAPVDHVIDTLGETAKLLSGWSDRVVPEKLRTLDRGRPWRDSQFASTRLSP
ncbi:hypothetical protein, partial [Bifidobacterium longum]|uniref:hypothetical protein n=1 Tax=Bifidobacterium longum TaxID=216816 RepID=UPI001E41B5D8